MRTPAVKYACGVVIGLLMIYGLLALGGDHGVAALLDRRRDIRSLEEQNQRLAREIEAKRAKIVRLQDNRLEQELVIRQRLKLLRPNERTYILDGPAER